MFNDYFASVGCPDNGITPNCNKRSAMCLDNIDVLVAIKKLKILYLRIRRASTYII